MPSELGPPEVFTARDLLTGTSYRWRTGRNFVGLAPGGAHVIAVRPVDEPERVAGRSKL